MKRTSLKKDNSNQVDLKRTILKQKESQTMPFLKRKHQKKDISEKETSGKHSEKETSDNDGSGKEESEGTKINFEQENRKRDTSEKETSENGQCLK